MPAPKILIVDDQPINVQLLKRKLEGEGMRTVSAYGGPEALELAASTKPDLILLDVMMPDMDGIEVCQRLQRDETTRHIPVIFITARNTKENKLEGLGAGAVDYITKPIDLDETLARVRTQLRCVALNRATLDLQHRLLEARAAATVGAVTQGIAHNLNNLLGVVLGYLDLVKAGAHKPEQVKRGVGSVEEAVHRIVAIVRQLSALAVNARLPQIQCKIDELLAGAVARYQHDYHIDQPVTVANPLGDLALGTNIEVMEDALGKILINAWEAYGDKHAEARPIFLRTAAIDKGDEGRFIAFTVEDAGCGIQPEIRDAMFEPFISSKKTVGVGMGLTVARHALRSLGGEVTVQDRVGGGTIVTLLHPEDRRRKKRTEVFGTTPLPHG
jgi:two-component system sensor histidine kinase/response regulator